MNGSNISSYFVPYNFKYIVSYISLRNALPKLLNYYNIHNVHPCLLFSLWCPTLHKSVLPSIHSSDFIFKMRSRPRHNTASYTTNKYNFYLFITAKRVYILSEVRQNTTGNESTAEFSLYDAVLNVQFSSAFKIPSQITFHSPRKFKLNIPRFSPNTISSNCAVLELAVRP